MILTDSPLLRTLTRVREQLLDLRGQINVDDVAVGADFADALDIFDDAIVAEVRAINAREASDEPPP